MFPWYMIKAIFIDCSRAARHRGMVKPSLGAGKPLTVSYRSERQRVQTRRAHRDAPLLVFLIRDPRKTSNGAHVLHLPKARSANSASPLRIRPAARAGRRCGDALLRLFVHFGLPLGRSTRDGIPELRLPPSMLEAHHESIVAPFRGGSTSVKLVGRQSRMPPTAR
jgi:hypothetical protein